MEYNETNAQIEYHIRESIETFRLSWKMVSVLIAIERFDILWPSIRAREKEILKSINDQVQDFPVPASLLLNLFENCASDSRCVYDKLQRVMFWYETDIVIHPLIRCFFLAYFIQICGFDKKNCIPITTSLLIEAGFLWVKFIPFKSWGKTESPHLDQWVLSCLSILREGQLTLLKKIDRSGTTCTLTSSERLLIYILDVDRGITTRQIARKLGKSEATVRRMLGKFRHMKIITSFGSGPKVSHELVCLTNPSF